MSESHPAKFGARISADVGVDVGIRACYLCAGRHLVCLSLRRKIMVLLLGRVMTNEEKLADIQRQIDEMRVTVKNMTADKCNECGTTLDVKWESEYHIGFNCPLCGLAFGKKKQKPAPRPKRINIDSEEMDQLADVFELWKKWRSDGRTSGALASALRMLIEDSFLEYCDEN